VSGGFDSAPARVVANRRARFSIPTGTGEAVIAFGAVAAVAFSSGGYWSTSWGWVAIASVWVLAVSLVARSVSLGGLDLVALGALGAFACWVAVSGLWGTPARSVLEAERMAMYVVAFAAALVVVRREALVPLIGGVWAAMSAACSYGLLTRLLPERLGVFNSISGYRLSEPLGYWNGLGVFAAIGFVLALTLAARAAAPSIRATAAASLPILGLTIYFTFSRGAWIALAVGLLVTIALDPRRLQLVTTLLALGPAVLVTLAFAYRSTGLNRVGSALAETSAAGHRVIGVVAAAMLANVLIADLLRRCERRITPTENTRRVYTAVLVVFPLTALVLVFMRFGSPPTLASRAYDAFAAPPPRVGTQLNDRLFNLSGSGRLPTWRVAWHEFEREPVLGSGAGTYEQSWNELRPYAAKVRDAHSLYLETLAELGVLGLALLLAALATPVVAALRARQLALVPGVFGAYTVFLVHAGVDWDWELPAVTLVALLCAAALLVAVRGEHSAPVRPRALGVALAAALGVAVFSAVGLLGNRALSDADASLRSGDVPRAAERARAAIRWAPWSAEAHLLLAEAQLAQGEEASARGELREAVAADPRDWTLWFALAQTTSGSEQDRALAEARRLNPRSPDIRAYVRSAKGRP
jgi:hypothetical protein